VVYHQTGGRMPGQRHQTDQPLEWNRHDRGQQMGVPAIPSEAYVDWWVEIRHPFLSVGNISGTVEDLDP